MLIFIQSIQNESDRNLVEELYKKYSRSMLYIAKSILEDQYSAEDAVSQAFIRIIDKLQNFSFENCNQTGGLLGIVVRDICYDMLKSDKSKKIIPLDDAEDLESANEDEPLDDVILKESYDFVMDCLSHLNVRHKDILRLKLVHELTDEEISQLLGITLNNVHVRIHRARKALLEEMRKRSNGNE